MASERKRANVFGEDHDEAGKGSPKRAKGNAQGQPSFLPPPMPQSAPPPPPPAAADISALVAQKRAEVQAKLAAMRSKMAGAPPANAPPPPPPSSSRSTLPPVPGLPKPNLDPDLARKVADAKRLVESFALKGRSFAAPVNPYMTAAPIKKNDPVLDPAIAGRGGLGMMAHPLLMDNSAPAASSKKDRYKPMTPKFSTTQANNRAPAARPTPVAPVVPEMESLVDTPYFDPRLSYGSDSLSVKSHMGRGPARETLKFNPKGKFVRLGEGLRAEAKMEELKKRILESARKAGLESEMEDQARIIKRAPPPEIEWWDAPFLPEKTYDSFSPSYLESTDAITIYIQHPIQIPAPQDKIKVEPKALFLTKKEQKKMRRQRRAAALRDKQDRIKMGLLPPDAPRVKLSNMMKVLTQDAIADPTKVEAQVRREMVAREKGHLKANADRKLTDEERRAKTELKKDKDAAKGIGAMCYKVRYLSDPAHKAKVRNNALQDGLTGIIIYNPKFCLIVVEGGAKGLRHFRNLMLRRIDWTAEARAREGDVVPEPVDEPMEDGGEGSEMGAMGELAAPASLADNTCSLVWEGQHRERMFMRIRQASCPSDSSAKEALGAKLEGLWDVAKSEVKDDE